VTSEVGQSSSPLPFSKGVARVSWVVLEIKLLERLGIWAGVVSVLHWVCGGFVFLPDSPLLERGVRKEIAPDSGLSPIVGVDLPVSPEAFGERYVFGVKYAKSCIFPSGEKVFGISCIGKGAGSFSWASFREGFIMVREGCCTGEGVGREEGRYTPVFLLIELGAFGESIACFSPIVVAAE
jgi:hypothetical protein